MSLDRPFNDELRRRQHRAAKWWFVGDSCYYLGLLGGLVAGPVLVLLAKPMAAIIAFGTGAAVFYAGAAMKHRSYVLGARDGIRVDEY